MKLVDAPRSGQSPLTEDSSSPASPWSDPEFSPAAAAGIAERYLDYLEETGRQDQAEHELNDRLAACGYFAALDRFQAARNARRAHEERFKHEESPPPVPAAIEDEFWDAGAALDHLEVELDKTLKSRHQVWLERIAIDEDYQVFIDDDDKEWRVDFSRVAGIDQLRREPLRVFRPACPVSERPEDWLRPQLRSFGLFSHSEWIEIRWDAGPTDRIRQHIAAKALAAYSADGSMTIAWLDCPGEIELPYNQFRIERVLETATAAEDQAKKKYLAKREAKKRRQLAEQGIFSAAANEGEITNTDGFGPDDKPVPLTSSEILDLIHRRFSDFPAESGGSLFVPDGRGGVIWLETPTRLFAWLGAFGQVNWSRGANFVSKEEFFEFLKIHAKRRYAAIEKLPHEPPLPGHFYARAASGDSSGAKLATLLSRLCPASEIDRELIRVAFVTPFWGGPAGARPAFLITAPAGRGSGKTTLAEMIGDLAGGHFDISLQDRLDELRKRLLSPDARSTRVALVDNVKTDRVSSSDIESLVTSKNFTGTPKYGHETSRPNLMTWYFTMNGAAACTDIAQRAIVIELAKPTYDGTWLDETRNFIRANRDALVAEILELLRQLPAEVKSATRWGEWWRNVVCRACDPSLLGAIQDAIISRQRGIDVEAEEASDLDDQVSNRLNVLGYSLDIERVWIPSDILRDWFMEFTGEKNLKTTAVTRRVKQMIDSAAVRWLQQSRDSRGGRGFIFAGTDSSSHSYMPLRQDIRQRIDENRAVKEGMRQRIVNEIAAPQSNESQQTGNF